MTGNAPARAPVDVAATTPRRELKRSTAILVYLLLLVSLQIFLVVIAVEGLLGHDPGLARAAAVLSALLFASTLTLRWFLGDH